MTKRILLQFLLSAVSFLPSANAQTNTAEPMTNAPKPRAIIADPYAEANKLIAYRTSQIDQLRKEVAALRNQMLSDNKRDELKERSGQATTTDRRASAARRAAQNQKMNDMQKKIAALQLEVSDIRKRYNIPEAPSRKK